MRQHGAVTATTTAGTGAGDGNGFGFVGRLELDSVFGWTDFRRGGKCKGWKTGRKISLPGPPIFSSQIGRKIKGRKLG